MQRSIFRFEVYGQQEECGLITKCSLETSRFTESGIDAESETVTTYVLL